MPIWPLHHIPSIEIHNSDVSLSDVSIDSAVGGPFPGEIRGVSRYVQRHCDGPRPRTEAHKGSMNGSWRRHLPPKKLTQINPILIEKN